MTIPTTYAQLKSEVANWLKRDDLTNDIETFINFGESMLNRVCRLSNQETLAAVVTTPGQNYTSLPSGFLEHISLTYDQDLFGNPVKVDLTILDQYKDQIGSGAPTHFAISNGNFYWNYMADSSYNLTSRYWKKWDIAGDSTNWLLTNYPDAYLFTALAQGGKFLRHPMANDWSVIARDVLDQLEYQSSKLKKASLRMDQGLLNRGWLNDFNINRGG